MRPHAPLLWLGLLFFVLPMLCHAQDEPPPTEAVTELLRTRIETEKRGVGIVVGLIDAKYGERIIPFGRTALIGGQPVNDRTMFEIGSISKVFTTLLLAEAVERGEMKLDDPVSKYLPPDARMPTRNGRQITLLDLATQRSGLPRLLPGMRPANPADPYADCTAVQVYAGLSGYTLTRDIGSQYEYSNLGVALLGLALAHHKGTDYEPLVVRDVCKPLGMTDTCITLTDELRSRLAAPFDEQLAPASNWNLGVFAGAGGLRSDMDDMLKFLAANMGGPSPLTAAMKLAHQVRNDAGSPTMDIGLAWHISKLYPPPITWHNGGTGGYRTFLGFDDTRHRGVVVLSNTANDVDDLALHLLNPQYKLGPPPKKPVPLRPEIVDRYVGRYQLAPDFVLTFSREGSHYFLQATGQGRNEVFPSSETDFFLPGADVEVTFGKSTGDRFDSVTLRQRRRGIPDQTARRLP